MICPRVNRRKKHEDEVDRQVIYRGKIDRLSQLCNHANDAIETLDLAMRYCDPASKTGGTESFALGQPFDHERRVDRVRCFSKCCQMLE